MLEALILESVNPEYDNRFFIDLQLPRKIQVQNMLCTKIVLNAKTKNLFFTQHVLNLYFSRTELVIQ